MKKKVVFILLTVVLVIISAVAVASADSPTKSTVYWWWSDPAGSSTIVRTDKGVNGIVSTSLSNSKSSAKGLAVTLWLVVFNNPEKCATSPCGESDLFNSEVKADILYGTGRVVGRSEKASFGFHRNAGDNSGSIADVFGLPTNNGESWGLIYPRTAEIHYVLRSHGPKVPRNMPAQIQNFEGGCVTDFLPPANGSDELNLDEGECQDIQFAIHQPE